MNVRSTTSYPVVMLWVLQAAILVLMGGCIESNHAPSRSVELFGTVPDTVSDVAVVPAGNDHVIYWAPVENADRYVILWSSVRQDVIDFKQGTPFTVVAEGPHRRTGVNPDEVIYYRVVAFRGHRFGGPSNIARSVVLRERNVDLDSRISPALIDINDDGCLDAVGAIGDCAGGFFQADMESQGTSGLLRQGRVNRDSRFADFDGDGMLDIFTNVYSRADNPESHAILHINNGDNTFREDPRMGDMELGGFGETVLAADFNNDGHVDIFVPNYWHLDDGGRYWLLINDGTGKFEDIAESAGVSVGVHARPEGAQAIDFNEDGWIDIYVGSQLFVNNGDLTFTDRREDYGLPLLFDEGIRFSDIDLDGDLDLIHHDRQTTRIFSNSSGQFEEGIPFNYEQGSYGFGLNVCDINGDGFEDVVVANNDSETDEGTPRLFINVGGELEQAELPASQSAYNDLLVCADLNGDKNPDILARQRGYTAWLSKHSGRDVIEIRILGARGQANQQGRLVRVTPLEASNYSMTRVVESGSGYMAQAGYDLIVGAPWPGDYEVAVRFADQWVTKRTRQGGSLTIYEDGRVEQR